MLIPYTDYNMDFMRHDLYALYKCLYLWEYMQFTGSGSKNEFYKRRKFKIEHGTWDCPCCDNGYAKTKLVYDRCQVCLLNGYAWKKNSKKSFYCVAPGDTLYREWEKAKRKRQKSHVALKMVNAIKKAIYDIEMKKLRTH